MTDELFKKIRNILILLFATIFASLLAWALYEAIYSSVQDIKSEDITNKERLRQLKENDLKYLETVKRWKQIRN